MMVQEHRVRIQHRRSQKFKCILGHLAQTTNNIMCVVKAGTKAELLS